MHLWISIDSGNGQRELICDDLRIPGFEGSVYTKSEPECVMCSCAAMALEIIEN